eukprot:SAG25_NODE_38_length_19656_cov_132.022038_20_plen_37_part_00
MQCQYYGCTAFRLLYEYEYRSHTPYRILPAVRYRIQ